MHDSHFLVWPWHLPLLLGMVGALSGALGHRFLERRGWPKRRQWLVSASLLPALVVVLCAAGWMTSSPGADGWANLVDVLWLTLALAGGGFTFVGGVAGAALASWWARRA
jgi:predicted PurR-regulated permease PerM